MNTAQPLNYQQMLALIERRSADIAAELWQTHGVVRLAERVLQVAVEATEGLSTCEVSDIYMAMSLAGRKLDELASQVAEIQISEVQS